MNSEAQSQVRRADGARAEVSTRPRSALFGQVGLALQALRELRGSSQAALSRKAGIGKSQLSKYENGKELPKLDSLEKILLALEIRPHTLFYVSQILSQILEDNDFPSPLLAEAGFGANLLTQKEQEAYSRVLLDLMNLFQCQLEGRIRATVKHERSQGSESQ